MLSFLQHRIDGNDLQRLATRQLDQIGIFREIGPPEIEPYGLSGTGKLTHPSLLQILLGDSKSFGVILKAFQAMVHSFGYG